jgi:hypothetical protein
LRHNLAVRCSDGAQAQALRVIDNRELGTNTPVFVLLFLAEELDAFVDFNVLLTTDVRGLELVVRHDDSELN